MARSSLRSTAPSQAFTTVTICCTVFGSLTLALMAMMAAGVVDSLRRYPQADSGGPTAVGRSSPSARSSCWAGRRCPGCT